MNEFLMFLTDNFTWILVVIALIIITIIGFLADKKKSNEKKEIKESKTVSMEVPTFIHNGIEENEDKKENTLSSNDIQKETSEIPENNLQDSQSDDISNKQIVMEQKNEQPTIQQTVNAQNNGLNSSNAIPVNNYNNLAQNNQNNINNYPYGMPTPLAMNPQMNKQNVNMQQQNRNPMNNYNNPQQQIQNNMNSYQNGMHLHQQAMNSQMNMQNNGVNMQSAQPINNYNNQVQQYNNRAQMTQPMVNSGIPNHQRVNMASPQQMNQQVMKAQQPVMNTQMNNAMQHQPIKVTPIAGMTGSAVSFVNGPINNNQNQQ